jgi:uncharacterized protein YjbJ (UPF0337 family)
VAGGAVQGACPRGAVISLQIGALLVVLGAGTGGSRRKPETAGDQVCYLLPTTSGEGAIIAPPASTLERQEPSMADRDDRSMREKGAENSLRGTGNDIKGRVKDAAGGLTGDNSMQAEGKWDKVKGKVQKKVGEAQDRIGRETDRDEI